MGPSRPVALVLAAGRASRFGDPTPKQFLELAGRPVMVHAVAQHVALGHHVVLVVGEVDRDRVEQILAQHVPTHAVEVVTGGATRRESVLAGIDAIPWTTHPDTAVVLRNAASPNTPDELVDACVAELATADGSQAFVRSDETTFIRTHNTLDRVIEREATGFTVDPTVYRRSVIDAIAEELRRGQSGETTLDVARRLGADIALVESPRTNIKLTQPGDLERLAAAMRPAAETLRGRRARPAAASRGRGSG